MKHGSCCYCGRCGEDHDSCRCSLDDAVDEAEALQKEVNRLRDIISPGQAAEYEEGMAALEAKVEKYKQMHYFDRRMIRAVAEYDLNFWFAWDEDEKKAVLTINVNDQFVPAADAEDVPEDEVLEVIEIFENSGRDGLTEWVRKKRGHKGLTKWEILREEKRKKGL